MKPLNYNLIAVSALAAALLASPSVGAHEGPAGAIAHMLEDGVEIQFTTSTQWAEGDIMPFCYPQEIQKDSNVLGVIEDDCFKSILSWSGAWPEVACRMANESDLGATVPGPGLNIDPECVTATQEWIVTITDEEDGEKFVPVLGCNPVGVTILSPNFPYFFANPNHSCIDSIRDWLIEILETGPVTTNPNYHF